MAQCLNLVSLRLNACCVQGNCCSTAQMSTEVVLTVRANCMEKEEKYVTWYCQVRAAYGALNLDHVYTKSFMSPLYPVPQQHSLNANRCLCGSCPSSQQVPQLLDSKFPLLYVGKLPHFGAHACFCQHILQNVSWNGYKSRKWLGILHLYISHL